MNEFNTITDTFSNLPVDGVAQGVMLSTSFMLGGMFIVAILAMLVIALALYIYVSLCLFRVAKKLAVDTTWMAWVPIAQLFLLAKMSNKSYWWVLLCFITPLSIISFVIFFLEILKKLNVDEWFIVLLIIPGVNLFAFGYLAFSSGVKATAVGAPIMG